METSLIRRLRGASRWCGALLLAVVALRLTAVRLVAFWSALPVSAGRDEHWATFLGHELPPEAMVLLDLSHWCAVVAPWLGIVLLVLLLWLWRQQRSTAPNDSGTRYEGLRRVVGASAAAFAPSLVLHWSRRAVSYLALACLPASPDVLHHVSVGLGRLLATFALGACVAAVVRVISGHPWDCVLACAAVEVADCARLPFPVTYGGWSGPWYLSVPEAAGLLGGAASLAWLLPRRQAPERRGEPKGTGPECPPSPMANTEV